MSSAPHSEVTLARYPCSVTADVETAYATVDPTAFEFAIILTSLDQSSARRPRATTAISRLARRTAPRHQPRQPRLPPELRSCPLLPHPLFHARSSMLVMPCGPVHTSPSRWRSGPSSS